MRIDRIAPGDIVKAAIKGRVVFGEVREVSDGVVRFDPLSPVAGWRHARAHEVVGHWRKVRRGGAGSGEEEDLVRTPREQLSLPGFFT